MPIETLTAKLKTIYKLQDTLPKLIDDASVPAQRMEDYYVDLQITVGDKSSGEKRPIKIQDIFGSVGNQQSADKILVVGGAGAGKTTLLHHVSYEWSKGEIFNDKFEYIFQVKLKKLLSIDQVLADEEIENYLAKLISLSIKDQQIELRNKFADMSTTKRAEVSLILESMGLNERELFKVISVEDINQVLEQSRTLLLLDGYDEVAHKFNRKGVIKTVLDDIFLYQHVLVTSRPNALNTEMEQKFERKIDSNGLSQRGINKYIEKYFANQQIALKAEIKDFFEQSDKATVSGIKIINYFYIQDADKSKEIAAQLQLIDGLGGTQNNIEHCIDEYFSKTKTNLFVLLNNNLGIRELVATPINIAMLCLICSDSRVLTRFEGDISLGQLYQEVIVWLGKRHENKKEDSELDLKDLDFERIFSMKELKILKDIAHYGFKDNMLIIKGQIIDGYTKQIDREITVEKVHKFGALRVDSSGERATNNQWINNEYAFVHLSFQEYLSAHRLKEKLMSNLYIDVSAYNDGSMMIKEYQQAVEFIATHRNEPRYLMPLKFLAGLVTNEQGEHAQILVTRFWEAITCNVDGSIELGLNTKVTLWMHLLAQATLNGELYSRIPQLLDKLTKLIDAVIVTDVTGFAEQISASGYSSPLIIENVRAILHLDYEWKVRREARVINDLSEFVEIADIAITNLKRVANSLDQGIKLKELATQILQDNAIPLTPVTSTILMDNAVAISSQGFIEVAPLQGNVANLHKIELQVSIKIALKLAAIGKMDIQELQNQLLEIMKHPNWKIKLIAINAMTEIITNNALALSGFNFETAKKIIDIMQWHIADDNLKQEVVSLFILIKNSVIEESAKIEFTKYLGNALSDQLQIFHKAKKIEECCDIILPTLSSAEVIYQEIVDELLEQLKTDNWLQQYNAMILLGEVAKKTPEFISDDIIANLLDRLNNYSPNYNSEFQSAFIHTIGAIVFHKTDSDVVEKLEKIFYNNIERIGLLIIKIVNNNAIKKSEFEQALINGLLKKLALNKAEDESGSVRSGAATALGEIAKADSSLITPEAIVWLTANLRLAGEEDYNGKIRIGVATALGEIAKVDSRLITPEAIAWLITNLRFTDAEDFLGNIRRVATTALGEIAKADSKLITSEVIAWIAASLRLTDAEDLSGNIRIGAATALGEIAKIDSRLITSEAIFWFTSNLGVLKAANILGEIAKVDSRLITPEAIVWLTANLKLTKAEDYYGNIRIGAFTVLGGIAKAAPSLITIEIIACLTTNLRVTKEEDYNGNIRIGAATVLGEIAKADSRLITPEAIAELVSNLRLTREEDDIGNIRVGAATALGEIAKADSRLITPEAIAELVSNLRLTQAEDYLGNIRLGAATALGEIAKADSKLITPEVIACLTVNLRLTVAEDEYSKVRISATTALGEIVKSDSRLITPEAIVWLTANLRLTYAEDCSGNIRIGATTVLGEVAKVDSRLITPEAIVWLTANLRLNEEENYHEKIHKKLKISTAIALGEIAKADSSLITSENIVHVLANLRLTKVEDLSRNIRIGDTTVLEEIAKADSSLITPEVITWLLADLRLIREVNEFENARGAAAIALGRIAKADSSLITPEVIAQLTANLKLPRAEDDHGNARGGVATALGEIAKADSKLITHEVMAGLTISLKLTGAEDTDGNVRGGAATALGEIAKADSSLITPEVIALLTANLRLTEKEDYNGNARGAAAIALGEIAKADSRLITLEAIEQVLVNLKLTKAEDKDGNVRGGAATALGGIAKIDSSLITSEVIALLTVNLRLTETEDFNGNIRGSAASVLGEIAKVDSKLITIEIIAWLTANLRLTKTEDYYGKVRGSAATALGEIFKSNSSLITIEIIALLTANLKLTKAEDEFGYARGGAAIALEEIAKVDSSLITETTIIILIEALSNGDAKIKAAISNALKSITTSLPSLAVQYLNHSIKDVREVIAEALITLLSDPDKVVNIQIDTLLSMIAFDDSNDRDKQSLIKAAKNALSQRTKEDIDIEWLTQNYNDILKLSKESLPFLQSFYHYVLSDGMISEPEKDFIIKSIQNGMATSFTNKGQIVFEGVTYTLQDEESKSYLREIIQVALEQKDDILVKQYNAYKPIFANSKSGMKIAASDIPYVNSVVGANNLKINKWQMSLMHLSDNKKTEPSQTFILLERRDEFGNHEVHKLAAVANLIQDEVSYTHPTLIDVTFRKKIFSGIPAYDVYNNYKPRYYATIIRLDLNEGNKLIESTKYKTINNDNDYQILHEAVGIMESWAMYVQNAVELTKTQLLDLSEDSTDLHIKIEAESAKRDSFAIWTKESLEDLNQFKEMLKDKIDFKALETILNREQYSQQQQEIITSLDAYQYSFYQELVVQLNAMYVATSSINSQLIDSNGSNQATTGKIGGFLQSISSHVPLVGVGVQMIGAIMVQVDQNDQANSIARYATIVADSGGMAKLAGKIAIKLASHARELEIPKETVTGRVGKAMDMLSEAVASSETATQVVSALRTFSPTDVINSFNFVDLAASCISGLKSRIHDANAASAKCNAATGASETTTEGVKKYAERLLFGAEQSAEDKEVAEGQAQANDIAAFIIKQIFAGTIIAGNDRALVVQIQNIVSLISQQFGLEVEMDNSMHKASGPSVEDVTLLMTKAALDSAEEIQTREQVLLVGGGGSISKSAAVVSGRFIKADTLKLLTQNGPGAMTSIVTENDFRIKEFDFDVSVDIIKKLADLHFGEGKHNIARGTKKLLTLISINKINLVKQLKAEASSTPKTVAGDTILKTLAICKGIPVESSTNTKTSLDKLVDISWLNALLETEQQSRPRGQSERDDVSIWFVNDIIYDNLVFNKEELLYEAFKVGGSRALNNLINLGEDRQIADEIIEATEQYGAKHVVSIIFGADTKQDITSSSASLSNNALIVSEGTQQTFEPNDNNYHNSNKYKPEVSVNHLMVSSFVLKEAIEAAPVMKYFINDILHISYSLPNLIDNNYFKLAAHYIACNVGMFAVSGKLNLIISSGPSLVYGAKIMSYELLAKQKQMNFENTEDKSIDSPVELIEKCGFDIVAQMVFGSLGSIVAGTPVFYDLVISASIGGMQCYSLYNQEERSGTQTSITQTIIPYAADTLMLYATASSTQFDFNTQIGQMLAIKQGLSVLSSVVITDHMTKLFLSSIQENNLVKSINNVVEEICSYFVGEVSGAE